jgi:hypothetical protein
MISLFAAGTLLSSSESPQLTSARKSIWRFVRMVLVPNSRGEPWSYLGSFGDDFLDEEDGAEVA